MQVKKFEAKTMKEALELVKRHLGPEAIILSARDNSRGFGIAGQRSVEITAAISDETLRRKRLAESKLTDAMKEKFEQVPARVQKTFIQKAATKSYISAEVPPAKPLRYAEIPDEESSMELSHIGGATPTPTAEARVRSAAQRAFQAMNEAAVVPQPPKAVSAPVMRTEPTEIRDLKAEIMQLKSIIESFKKVPQSFVTMHPGAEHGLGFELSAMFQKLLRAGLNLENTVEILRTAQSKMTKEQISRPAYVDAWVAKYIMDQIFVADGRTDKRVHLFMGPSGQGKTSAVVKMAGHMVICEKKKIALATTDSIKVGAAEQLRIYAQILNVPFVVIRNAVDWAEVKGRLGHVDHILVDYPGLNLKSIQEIDSLRAMLPQVDEQVSIHYVQSVLANEETAFEVASRYQMIGFHDVIFTGLDEAAQHGLIYNFQRRFKVPLHSFGVGRQIPEDLEPATKERVIDLIFKLSKVRKDKTA